MPDEYYSMAESEFRAAVDKYNKEHGVDITIFKAKTDHVWIEDNNVDLYVGRRVRLESTEYFPEIGYRDSRITKITRKVSLPTSMDIEIGDAIGKTSKQTMTDSITETHNYSTYLFKENSATLSSHIANATVHISASERTNWNNKLDKAAFDELFEKKTDANGKTYIFAKFTVASAANVVAYADGGTTGGTGGGILNTAALQTWLDNNDYETATDILNAVSQDYALKSHTHSQYLTAITKAMVEGVLTGNITSHTHSQYLTAASLHTLTIQKNGTTVSTYSPAADKTINITDVASAAALSSHTSNTTVHITAAERTKWNKVVTDFAAITGSDSDTVINKWEEVVAFLDSYTEADTLAGLLSHKVDKVSGMGLSHNDLTDALLTKLNGIEAGANKYVHPTATATTVNAAAGRVLSAITVNSLGHVTSVSYKTLAAADIPALDWSKITTGKPTTIGGYGITDAYTKTQSDNLLALKLDKAVFDELFEKKTDSNGKTYILAKFTVASAANVVAYTDGGAVGGGGAGGTVSDTHIKEVIATVGYALASDVSRDYALKSHVHAFADLTAKPTTLSGYGITDAYTKAETDGRYARLQMPNNLVFGGNEVTFIPAGYNNTLWLNYHGAGANGATGNGIITEYRFGNGSASYAPVYAASFIKNGGTSAQVLMADGSVVTAGCKNGNIARYVAFPSWTILISAGYLTADYKSEGHPDEKFMQATCKWLIATYPSGGVFVGAISPNSAGYVHIHVYNSGVGADGYPAYCSGTYYHLTGRQTTFGTYNGKWSYDIGFFSGTASKASRWATARTITLSGAVTGSVSIDGSANVTLATTVNHTHAWSAITGKPTTLAGFGITDALGFSVSTNYLAARFANADLAAKAADTYIEFWQGGKWFNFMTGSLTANGTVKATSIVKNGGTAAQFLMADGSVKALGDITSAYVTALGTSGNYLTWTKNGAVNNITVPFATTANNADMLDGEHSTAFRRKWQTSAGGSHVGWVRIMKWTLTSASHFSPDPFILQVRRGYNSPQPESYTLSFTFGWGTANIVQLNGTAVNRIIEQFRITRTADPKTYYLEYYVNPSYTTYKNAVYCAISTYKTADDAELLDEVTTETLTAICTITTVSNAVVSPNFIGALTGNTATATRLSDSGTYTVWGQPFFKNGVPKNVSGALTSVTDITMTGKLYINAASSSAYLTADMSTNMYAAVAGKILLVLDGANGVVRGGNAVANTIDLGTAANRWRTLYASTIDANIVKIGGGTISFDSAKGIFKFSHTVASDANVVAYADNGTPGGTGGGILNTAALQTWLDNNDYKTSTEILQAVSQDYALKSHTHSQYLTAITKAMVEGVLTGNITSHTHSQYLTAHQSIYDLTIQGNGTTLGVFDPNGAAKTINITAANIGAAAASHTHESLKQPNDTRYVATVPTDYDGRILKFTGMKYRTTLGLPTDSAGGTYANGFGWRGWSDYSGGNAWEIFGDNNKLYCRHGDTTAWEAWKAFAFEGHKQAYTAAECDSYTADDNTMGVTPAAVKKAIGLFEPKAHTHAWSALTGKPSTLAGYGITDAYSKTQADSKYVALAGEQTITGKKKFNGQSIYFLNGAPSSSGWSGNASGGIVFCANTESDPATNMIIGQLSSSAAQDGVITQRYMYMGWGATPYVQANCFAVSKDIFRYKGYDILHTNNYAATLDRRYLKLADFADLFEKVSDGRGGYYIKAKYTIASTGNLAAYSDGSVTGGTGGGGAVSDEHIRQVIAGVGYALASDVQQNYALASHTHSYAGADTPGGASKWLLGSYTKNGGQQGPSYFGRNKVGALMMNTTVNGNSNYKDWLIMDCYYGSDVGGAVAIGVNRQALGAYIMRSEAARTAWAESAELIGTHNYTNYCATASHTHADYVTALSTSGNNLVWTRNGVNNTLTVPYATNADTVDGLHASQFFRAYGSLGATDINTVKNEGSYHGYQQANAGYPNDISNFLVLNYSKDWGTQLQFAVEHKRCYVRFWRNAGGIMDSSWNTLAFITDKVAAATKADSATTAASATKLATARSINGTAFDGTADITTAYWGAMRAIGIVNSDGTGTAVTTNVNGGMDVNLRLPAVIKADLQGNATSAATATLAANALAAAKLVTARKINGTDFNGTADITTAQWGTARNIYIADATGAHTGAAVSVNGGTNATLKLPATITADLSGNASSADTAAFAAAADYAAAADAAEYATSAGKLSVTQVYTAWGRPFFTGGKPVSLSGALTGVTDLTMTGALTLPYSSGLYSSMYQRTELIQTATNNSTTLAHALLRLKDSGGNALVLGGIGPELGFYGFKAASITAGQNYFDWQTVWNVATGDLTHTGRMKVVRLDVDTKIVIGTGDNPAEIWYDADADCLRSNKTIASNNNVVAYKL